MVAPQNDNFLSPTTSRVPRKSISGISVTKMKRDEIIHSVENSTIKFPTPTFNEATSTSPTVKLLSSGSVNVSRIKSTTKPKPHNMDLNLQKTNKFSSVEDPVSTCRSARDVKIVRVSNLLIKPARVTPEPPIRDFDWPFDSNTIHPQVMNGTKNSSSLSENIKTSKVAVIRVPSSHLPKESGEECPSRFNKTPPILNASLSNIPNVFESTEVRGRSAHSVRVKRVPRARKDTNVEHNVTRPASTVQKKGRNRKIL